MFIVYIIYSAEVNVFYKGMTTDIEKRLFEHNNGLSRYTTDKGPWFLKYQESFETKREALIEEKRIKKLNRRSLEKLINT